MAESGDRRPPGEEGAGASNGAISIIQRGNLKALEQTLRKQWRLGQNIVLCWSADERGLLVIFVPHYFLGNYCADDAEHRGNEGFIRELISGRRRKQRDELFAICERLGVAPTFIKLNTALVEEPVLLHEVEQLIRRYGISYVEDRAVLLFDIVEFSLYTPFEQASQLNSLSYSLNSAYNKLLAQGIEINFARTTTGDGYYVWNRGLGADANVDLFSFLVLVVADNAVARAQSRGNTVPVIRAAYHIGGHYELYQAEGVNPTVFSYIVGDVTIELARIVDLASPNQVLVGDFTTMGSFGLQAHVPVSSPAFVAACNRGLSAVRGSQLSSKTVEQIDCRLSSYQDLDGHSKPLRLRFTDKHGLTHNAFNLEVDIRLDGGQLQLGVPYPPPDDAPPLAGSPEADTTAVKPAPPAASVEDLIDDLAGVLHRRGGHNAES
ncbi:hypothetical protein E4634_15510 [Mangrovimicrobium sediminis]|uniref:Uncharacterized protein n=1 Tax=Mangrovimicrobium sediminis TaxID=2562682 RepID=A0A4Z0LXW2_9GAMM|nr:hypothetical protein [Haliea sp. SAOS-164]TGD72080.1 hypothetical protein E4634_15510 [Haliea sp. SAOS-164]